MNKLIPRNIKKLVLALKVKSSFAQNTFILSIGTISSQVVSMLFYPILSRIFSPEEFGLLALIISITAILGTLSTGRYEGSILITDSKRDAANVIALILFLSSGILLFSYFIMRFFSTDLETWFGNRDLAKWLFVIPLNAFFIIIYNIYNEWCVRNGSFKELSWNKLLNSSANSIGKFFFGVGKIVSSGLVLGELLGRFITACFCVFRVIKKEKDFFNGISFDRIKRMAKRYIEFPMFSLPGALVNTFGGQLPIILIAFYFSSKEVGFYSMTMTVLSIPSTVISKSIRDTFRQRANEDYKKYGNCRRIFIKTFKLMLTLSVTGTILVFFLLPRLFDLFLGSDWITSGQYAQILIPLIALSFVSNSLSGVFIIAEKIKVQFFFQVYYLIISAVSLWVGYYFFKTVQFTLISFVVGRSTAYIFEIYLSYRFSTPKFANI